MQNSLKVEKGSDIVLRPRFQIELPIDNETVLKTFEKTTTSQDNFIVSRIDDHVFIKFPKIEQQFWTPQLHLEINETEEETSRLYGLFGPNPTVWLMFIFLHLVVILIFIGFAIWCYTNWSLNNPYGLQLGVSVMMIVLWVVLYAMGRIGRATNKGEMHKLYDFMNSVLEKIQTI